MAAANGSLQQMIEIDSLCESFELECKSGRSPSIEDYLDKVVDAMRPELLRELLSLELSRLNGLGEPFKPDDYRQRFASYISVVEETLKASLLVSDRAIESVAQEQQATADRKSDESSAASEAVDVASEPTRASDLLMETGPAPRFSQAKDITAQQHPLKFGRHAVHGLLGKGAFGTVYRAWDPSLCRDVAIKVLRGGPDPSQESKQQLLDEARSAVRLKHSHIVAVHDVGETEAGECFVVMDYVAGKTLQQVVRERKKLPPAEAIELVAKLADAIAEAHSQQIVHRDLKPGNVLIDARGEPCIVDFGMALNDSFQRLKKGEVSGTHAYMSPEQLRGEAHLLDGRTDIWALGVILHELLVGKRPFRGDTPKQLSEDIQHKPPTPMRQLDERLPAELDRIVQKALAKDSTQRYATARDLARDLRRVAKSDRRFWADVAVAMGAAVVFGALSFGAAGLVFNQRQPQDRPPISTTVFNPKLEFSFFRQSNQGVWDLLENLNDIRHGDKVQIKASNPTAVYMYFYWVDEEGLCKRKFPQNEELGSASRQIELEDAYEITVDVGRPGRDYLILGITERRLAPEELARLDDQTFRASNDRGGGSRMSISGKLPDQLSKTFHEVFADNYRYQSFSHRPPDSQEPVQ